MVFEAKMEDLFDKIILVYSNDNTRKKRLIVRNNYTEKEAELRIHSQMSQAEKINKSDYIIVNDSNIESLEENTLEALKDLINLIP